jgi:spore maturation protein B
MNFLTFLAKVGVYSFPVILMGVPLYAHLRGVPVYDAFIKGAEEGLKVAIGTLPYLVAIYVGISCLRGSGALELVSRAFGFLLRPLGLPVDVIPLIVIRPISGSGALALTGDILRTYGPDSNMGLLASILQGATDTSFFVVTVYFGAAGIRKTRHALAACLFGDLCGFIAAILVWRALVR